MIPNYIMDAIAYTNSFLKNTHFHCLALLAALAPNYHFKNKKILNISTVHTHISIHRQTSIIL